MNALDLIKSQFTKLPRETTANPQEGVKVIWREVMDVRNQVLPGKVFEAFKLKNEVLGDLFLKTAKAEGEGRHKISLNNRLGKELGYEVFSINPQNKNIFGFDITVNREYRQGKFRFGELLRLASVMEMMENNSKQIRIYSKDKAVYFHTKYKFKPEMIGFEERDKAIKSIMNDPAPNFADLAKEAKKVYEKIESTKNNAQTQRDLCVTASELAERYLKRAVQEPHPEKNHPLNWGMYMVLKQDDVRQNEDFFNALFKARGIDYKIC